MALSQLTSQDAGASARDKLNAAIAAVDALGSALAIVAQNRIDGDDALEAVRAATDDLLSRRIDSHDHDIYDLEQDLKAGDAATLAALVSADLGGARPGIVPSAFGTAALGAPGSIASLDPAARVSSPLGRAYPIVGAGLIAPRGVVAVDVDGIWILRARYWRISDVIDPNNNAVDLGIQWLNASDGDAGRTLLRREPNLRVQDGPRTLTFRVPSLEGDALAIRPPIGAVSWRPYLRTYGADGATAVALLSASEATFAGVYAPDVSALGARLGTIEGQLAAGLPLTAPQLPSYLVADLMAGRPPPNRGRQAWAQDGRARNADGTFEAANAGTGVEVQGNGTKWVYPGTNQAVQA